MARELGVRYLLVGKVRWQKGERGQPGRGEPRTGGRATGRADHTLAAAFQRGAHRRVPDAGDIAPRVAEAWSELGDSARRQVAARPTHDLAAYDAYLRAVTSAAGMRPRRSQRSRRLSRGTPVRGRLGRTRVDPPVLLLGRVHPEEQVERSKTRG